LAINNAVIKFDNRLCFAMYCQTNCGYYARLCDDCAVHTKYLHRD